MSRFPRFTRHSLRLKVTLAVLAPLLVILGLFTWIQYGRYHASMMKNLSMVAAQSGQVIETGLRQDMLKNDFVGVQSLLDSIQTSQGFQGVYLLNTSGQVIFASGKKDVGKLLSNRQPDCAACHSLPAEQRPNSVVVTTSDGQKVFRSMNPIENGAACKRCHDPNQQLIGLLLTDISTAPAEASLQSALRENLLWWLVTILAAVVVVNAVLDRLVLSRLEKFSLTIQDFGQKQLPPEQPDPQPDEIGRLSGAFLHMAGQIEARSAENQALSENLQRQSEERGKLLQSLIAAQENERARVARELHDELGQALGGLSLQAEITQRCLPDDPERAKEQLRQIQSLTKETVDCMYDIIIALRPSILDDLGLVAALRFHAERSFAGKGIDFDLDASQMPGRLPPELETALYRTFQEAISNIIRHSNASQVHMQLCRRDGHFEGQIADNGQGFDPASLHGETGPRGLGLLGMRERITQFGGRLEIASSPGSGTKISIHIPINEVPIG